MDNKTISKVMSEMAKRANKKRREVMGDEKYKEFIKSMSVKGVAARLKKKENKDQ